MWHRPEYCQSWHIPRQSWKWLANMEMTRQTSQHLFWRLWLPGSVGWTLEASPILIRRIRELFHWFVPLDSRIRWFRHRCYWQHRGNHREWTLHNNRLVKMAYIATINLACLGSAFSLSTGVVWANCFPQWRKLGSCQVISTISMKTKHNWIIWVIPGFEFLFS